MATWVYLIGITGCAPYGPVVERQTYNLTIEGSNLAKSEIDKLESFCTFGGNVHSYKTHQLTEEKVGVN